MCKKGKGCGCEDPCACKKPKSCACVDVDTKCIVYTGPDLDYLGIKKGERMDMVLYKANDLFCNLLGQVIPDELELVQQTLRLKSEGSVISSVDLGVQTQSWIDENLAWICSQISSRCSI